MLINLPKLISLRKILIRIMNYKTKTLKAKIYDLFYLLRLITSN